MQCLRKNHDLRSQSTVVEEKHPAQIQGQSAEGFGLRKRAQSAEGHVHALHSHDGEDSGLIE